MRQRLYIIYMQSNPTMKIFNGTVRLIVLLAAMAVTVSCARMGRPDGGWYDETPPTVVGTYPDDGGTGVKARKISIVFDEFIKLDNATEKVVVSPPQTEQPDIKSTGKRIVVELKDSLRANTTYTVDFSDAISDNNEGNPLGNYTYSFSTGNVIDTLQVAGNVLAAADLEPVKGVLVGLYADLADSAFTTKPMLRVARTDSRGRFVIRGVAPGTYRVYALADADGDYRFSQKSEQIAFTQQLFTPGFEPAVRQDTTWTDSLHIKSIARVGYTRFTPDDIVLRAFNEPVADRYLLKAERAEADRFTLYFSYGDDRLPELRGLDFDSNGAFLTEPSARRDTITYWLRDTAMVNRDTLTVQIAYLGTDTLGNLVPQTDTLQILSKQPYERRMRQAKKDFEDWQKRQEKKRKKGEPYDTVPPPPALKLDIIGGETIDPDRTLRFDFGTPVASADTSKIHLYARHDSLWYEARFRVEARPVLVPGDTISALTMRSPRQYTFAGEWRPGMEYSLELDSMAFTDIYGHHTQSVKRGLKVRSLDEYGSLVFTMSGLPDTATAVVELLDTQDRAVKRATVEQGTAQFYYITPGKYYARVFVDDNGNGVWDTGDYASARQPEAVFYYPEQLECKAKWDLTLAWNATERPLNRQKPEAITKQKAEKQRKIQKRNADRARKLGIAYTPQAQ